MNSVDTKSLKPIPNFDEGYFINKKGEIFKNGKKMSPINNGLGYYQIKLRKNKCRKALYVHRLVWEVFKGEIPMGFEINHIDHNKANNALSNLELVSHSENITKAVNKYGPFGFLKYRMRHVNTEPS